MVTYSISRLRIIEQPYYDTVFWNATITPEAKPNNDFCNRADLSSIQQHSIREHRFPKRIEEIFLGFLGLLPQHFEEHHDIGF